jgi:hypothetical protein
MRILVSAGLVTVLLAGAACGADRLQASTAESISIPATPSDESRIADVSPPPDLRKWPVIEEHPNGTIDRGVDLQLPLQRAIEAAVVSKDFINAGQLSFDEAARLSTTGEIFRPSQKVIDNTQRLRADRLREYLLPESGVENTIRALDDLKIDPGQDWSVGLGGGLDKAVVTELRWRSDGNVEVKFFASSWTAYADVSASSGKISPPVVMSTATTGTAWSYDMVMTERQGKWMVLAQHRDMADPAALGATGELPEVVDFDTNRTVPPYIPPAPTSNPATKEEALESRPPDQVPASASTVVPGTAPEKTSAERSAPTCNTLPEGQAAPTGVTQPLYTIPGAITATCTK